MGELVRFIKETNPVTIQKSDQSEVDAAIQVLIMNVFSFYGEVYTDEQRDFLIEKIKKDGFYLSLCDLITFQWVCMEGKYKNRVEEIDNHEFKITFFKLSPSVFVEWFLCFLKDRRNFFIEANRTFAEKEKYEFVPESLQLLKFFADKNKEVYDVKMTNLNEMGESEYTIRRKNLQYVLEREFKDGCKYETEENRGQGLMMYPCEAHIQVGDKKLTRHEYVSMRFSEVYDNLITEHAEIEGEKISLQEYVNSRIDILINEPTL